MPVSGRAERRLLVRTMPRVITYVLGVPGSGKTALAPELRLRLPRHVVIDWDAYMDAAGELAGRDIRANPDTWAAYRSLVRSIVAAAEGLDVVVLGVCTPDELPDWPAGPWILLDCSHEERRRRLVDRETLHDAAGALEDARRYRSLGFPIHDSTGEDLTTTAESLAGLILTGAGSKP